MKQNEPILIKPLRMRGVFGITWNLFRRNLASTFGFSSVYVVIVFATLCLAFLPLGTQVVKTVLTSGMSASSVNASAIAIIVSTLTSFFLFLLVCIGLFFMFYPMVNGTLYNEASSKIYGRDSSCSELLRYSKFNLKRFFTTSLCYIVGESAIDIVIGILFVIFESIFYMVIIFPLIIHPSTGTIFSSIILFAISAAVTAFLAVLCYALLAFTYPIAVNEQKKNFHAVISSIKLVWQRKGRVFGAYALLYLVLIFACCLIGIAGTMGFIILYQAAHVTAAFILLAVLIILFVLIMILMTPYIAIFNTVLYFDAKARTELSANNIPEAQYPLVEECETNNNHTWNQ